MSQPTNRRRAVMSALVHPVTQNALSLYGVYGASLLFPLIQVPYLARVLGPEAWGVLVFAQSFALWLAVCVEYGFNLSATREVARNRSDQAELASVVAAVLGAKMLLILGAALVALAGLFAVPVLRARPSYVFWAWLLAVGQGMSPLWFFQGLERLRGPAALDVGAKAVATVGVFALVSNSGDGWKVLALQAGAGCLSSTVALAWLYQHVSFDRPRVPTALTALRMGWTMFLFRGAVSLYTAANAFVLGLFAAPAVVADFGGAEKISKACVAMLAPISQALYPRISHLVGCDQDEAARLGRVSLGVMLALGLLGGGVVGLGARYWVRLLLGPKYPGAVPVLQLLAVLVPMIAVSTVLGIQWMLPLRMDWRFNAIIVAAGCLNILLAVLLAPREGAVGMAWAVVISEAFVTAAMWVSVRQSRVSLWPARRAGLY